MKKIHFKSYHNWRIQNKMFFAFIVGAIIPLLIIISISYQLNTKNIMQNIDELAVQNLKQMAERVKLTLNTYNAIVYQLNADDEIIGYIQQYNYNENQSKAVAYNHINNKLKQYNHLALGIRSISIVCREGGPVIYDYQTGSAISNIWQGIDLYNEEPYLKAKDKLGIVLSSTSEYKSQETSIYLFHLSKQLFNLNDLNEGAIATVIISIDSTILNEICNGDLINDFQEVHRIYFIVDRDGRVISYPYTHFNGYKIEKEMSVEDLVRKSGYFNKEEIILNAYVDQVTGWTYYSAYDKDYVLRDIKKNQSIYIVIGIVGFLFSGLLIFLTINKIHLSIKHVINGMQQIQEGNLEVVVNIESEDEIGRIAHTFNDMTKQVKYLINEVREATDKQKNAEIRALEAQINPHFLYNTLDSINWMAIEREEYEISTMLRNLGVILRYSINKSNEMVAIDAVVDWLEKYLSLQKMRFNNAFEWVLNIEEKTRKVKIYKLLLQPFVENTIIHGFKGIEQGGILHIDILMSQTGKSIQIIIEDNGYGMSKQQVELLNNTQEMIRDKKQGIGVQNTFSRLYMYYGDKAKWSVKSVLGMGTVIVLEIPFEEV